MNRRGFLRGVLSVVAASVAAKVAPKRPVAEPVMGVGRGSLLVMDNLGICNADAVLPLYIDDYGDLREASGRLVRYIVLDNAGIDTRLLRDVSDWTTPEARRLVESINSRYGGTADALFDQLVTGIERSGDMLQDHWRACQEFMADPDSIIRRQAAAWRGKGA